MTNRKSVEVLNEADSMERRLDWILFKQEQEQLLAYDPNADWNVGDSVFGIDYEEELCDCGCEGARGRPMFQSLDPNLYTSFQGSLYIRCQDCETFWYGDEPCFVCGKTCEMYTFRETRKMSVSEALAGNYVLLLQEDSITSFIQEELRILLNEEFQRELWSTLWGDGSGLPEGIQIVPTMRPFRPQPAELSERPNPLVRGLRGSFTFEDETFPFDREYWEAANSDFRPYRGTIRTNGIEIPADWESRAVPEVPIPVLEPRPDVVERMVSVPFWSRFGTSVTGRGRRRDGR